MYSKLAFRNMKRQLNNYLIYFITIAMTISLIFAMNNMTYNEDLQARANSFAEIAAGLLVLSIFLCIIIATVLGYANSFMLRLRKREFGTYLTVGMKRHQIIRLFLLENSLLGILACITGLFLGSFLYQGLMLLMASLLQFDFTFSMFSMKGIYVTLLMVLAIFIVSFLTSSIYLSRVTIYELIHGAKKVNTVQKVPILSLIITIASLCSIIYAYYNFSIHIEGMFQNNPESAKQLLLMIALFSLSIITFHIGLAKSLLYFLLKSRKAKQNGTNTFILRQLSATLNANALLLGLLAFLMAFSIISANTGFLYKAVEEENLERRFPFEIMGNIKLDEEPAISVEEATKKIEQVTTIEQFTETPIYSSGEADFLKQTSWYSKNFLDKDVYVRESDYNALLKATDQPPLKLQNEFVIVSDMPVISQFDFSQQIIEQNGSTYRYSHTETTALASIHAYFAIIVPDEVVQTMQKVQVAYNFDLGNSSFNAEKLKEELSYQKAYENYFLQRSDFKIKEYQRTTSLAFSAIFIVGALYLGFVFILLAMAILSLKTLSNISDDEQKYMILNRIGVARAQQTMTLAKQISLFFAFPIIVPLLLAIPTTMISEKFIALLGFDDQLNMTLLSIMIVLVISTIYSIYFFITFAITKKYVIK